MAYDILCAPAPAGPSAPSKFSETGPYAGIAALERSAGLLRSDIALPGWTQLPAGAAVSIWVAGSLPVVVTGVFLDLPSAAPARIC